MGEILTDMAWCHWYRIYYQKRIVGYLFSDVCANELLR